MTVLRSVADDWIHQYGEGKQDVMSFSADETVRDGVMGQALEARQEMARLLLAEARKENLPGSA